MRSDLVRKIAPAFVALATLGLATGAIAADKTDPASLKTTGKTTNCIPMQNVNTTTPAGENVLMFHMNGNKWYRNDLRQSCPVFSEGRALVFHNMTGGQYCSLDTFSVVDLVSHMNYGSCVLGSFTPVQVPKNAQF